MRKGLSLLLAFFMVISTLFAVPFTVSATTTETTYFSGDYEFKVLEDNTAEIIDYNGTETDLTIPSVLSGYKVTSIGNSAFAYCKSITEITIPGSVTSIGVNAFSGCSNLSKITISNGVKNIYSSAFSGCTSLTEITIPGSVTSIGYNAFGDCSNLTKVTILDGVTSIGNSAFFDCSSLTEVIIPNSVTSIGDDTFYGCSNLTEITIPDSVTSIGNWAFGYCTSLIKITIPDSVTSIDDYAFIGCTSLTELTIPDGVTSIGDYAFCGCSSLTEVTIPSSVTYIHAGLFDSCSELSAINVSDNNKVYDSRNGCNAIIETLTNTLIAGCKKTIIPNGVTRIDNYAFSGCTSLTEVTIPDGVTSIGEYAFYNCIDLTEATIPNSITSIGEAAFCRCSNLTEITIPDSVTSIGNWAFGYCTSLTEITIPNSVTSIGDEAFFGCENLESITIYSKNCTIGTDSVQKTAKLYCYERTTAEQYALSNAIAYEILRCVGDHTVVIDEAVTHDCENTGLTEGSHCSECNEVFVEQKIIPATGHSFTDKNDIDCNVCNRSFILIKFDSNGGTSISQIRTLPNQTTTLPSTVPTKSGYNFTGWATTKNGDVLYQAENTLQTDSAITLYAQWNKHCSTCEGDGIEEYSVRCTNCLGKGTVSSNIACYTCDGDGKVNNTSYTKCTKCNGTGKTDITTTRCSHCYGRGRKCANCGNASVTIIQGLGSVCSSCYSRSTTTCTWCNGEGSWTTDECSTCNGKGYISNQTSGSCKTCSGTGYTKVDCTYCPDGYNIKTTPCTACNETGEVIRESVSAPEKPSLKSYSNNTVVLNPITNGEYSIDGINWQENPIFEGIECEKEYTFYQRYRKTDTTYASESSTALTASFHHNYEWVIDKENSCDTDGIKHEECTVCQNKCNENTVIPAKGHTEVIDKAVDPTCESTGLYSGLHCSVCDMILVEQEIIPAKGHTEVIDEAIAPDYKNTGLTEGKHCSVCGTVLVKQEIIPALTGMFGDVDGDGKITIKDATAIQKYIAGIIVIDEEKFAYIDTDKDGKITVKDATRIQKFLASLIAEL